MIFDGEKKVYILSEQEYDEMFDGESHANLELIKVRNQLQEANEVIKNYAEKNGYHKAMDYLNKYNTLLSRYNVGDRDSKLIRKVGVK